MLRQKKLLILKTILMVLVLFSIDSFSYAYIMGNDGDGGYGGTGDKSTSAIRTYIIEGAGYFLASNSDFLLFLNKTETAELNGINYDEFVTILDRAIEKMEKANAVYTSLTETAAVTPYNQWFTDRLKMFDYDGFGKEQGWNTAISDEVKSYLSRGDITGFFAALLHDTGAILDILYVVKKEIGAGAFPTISHLWRANREYYQTVMFGQIAAEIFHKIKETN